MGFFDSFKSGASSLWNRVKSTLSKLNPFTKKEGKKVVKELLKKRTNINNAISKGLFGDGTICYYEYNPKDKTQVWDYKPLGLVLGISKGHILCCNFHWIDMKERLELIEYILKINKKGDGFNVPLKFTYKQLKPFLMQPKFKKCIHLYIRSRMSRTGVIIDPKYLLDVARLKLEHFQ